MPERRHSIDILTDEERQAWHDRDKVEFYAWFTRWMYVDFAKSAGKRMPRHRFNKKDPRLP